MQPSYAWNLVVGFVRAIFWSGGWPWGIPRLLILVGFLPPAVGFGEEVRAVLTWLFNISAENIPAWWFYVGGAGAIATVLAARLAYLETTRICVDNLEPYDDREGTEWIRIGIKNVSSRNIREDVSVRLVSSDINPTYYDTPPIDYPLVLTSQERMRAARENNTTPYYGMMSLNSNTPPKKIELFQVINKSKIMVRHQTGEIELTLGYHLFQYEALAAGNVVCFSVKCFYSKNSYKFILAKDKAMLYAFNELGNSGWWKSESIDGTR